MFYIRSPSRNFCQQQESNSNTAKEGMNGDTNTNGRPSRQWPYGVVFALALYSPVETLCTMRRVCKAFHDLAEHPDL